MSPCRASAGKTREKEKIELVNLGGFNIASVTIEHGWSWEKYVKPKKRRLAAKSRISH
jgi:hypothetical protein